MGSALLRYCNPAWVGTLRVGVAWMFRSMVALFSLSLLEGFVSRFSGFSLVMAVGIVPAVGTSIGQWLAATPDPGGRGESPYGTARKLVRVAAIVGIGRRIMTVVLRTVATPPLIQLPLTILSRTLSAAMLVGLIATFRYLGMLARRIPDDGLATRAGRLVLGLGMPLAVIEVYQAILALSAPFGVRWRPQGVVMILFVVVALVALGYGVSYLLLLSGLSKRLGREAALARQAWSAAENPLARGQRAS